MLAKAAFHFRLQFLEGIGSHNARDTFVCRTCNKIVTIIHFDNNFARNLSVLFFLDWQGDYFHPACFQMLFKFSCHIVSLSFPFTVTFPFFVGWQNYLWLPL